VLHRRADGQPWPCRLAWLLRSIGAVSGQRHRTAAFADSLAAAQQALVVADCCSAKNGAVSRPTAPTMLLVLTSSYADIGITPLMPSGWLCRGRPG